MEATLKATAMLALVILSLNGTRVSPAPEPAGKVETASARAQPAAVAGRASPVIEPISLRSEVGPSCGVTIAAPLPPLPVAPAPGAFHPGDSDGPEPLSRESDLGLLP